YIYHQRHASVFFCTLPRPPSSTLFPYTTLFRSVDVRRRLDFGFAGVPATPGAALSIFADNTRLLAVVFAAIALTQLKWNERAGTDRKSTRLNSSHDQISYAVFCLKKKNKSHH